MTIQERNELDRLADKLFRTLELTTAESKRYDELCELWEQEQEAIWLRSQLSSYI